MAGPDIRRRTSGSRRSAGADGFQAKLLGAISRVTPYLEYMLYFGSLIKSPAHFRTGSPLPRHSVESLVQLPTVLGIIV